MKRILLATACAVIMTATASAQVKYQTTPVQQQKQATLTYRTVFECFPPLSSTEANPVTRIYVGYFTWSDNSTTARVTHVLADGSERNRAEQYFNTNMDAREKNDFLRVVWTGRLKTNHHVTIAGNMTAGANNKGTYTESWFHDGKFTNKMTANCETKFNGAPEETVS